MCYNLSHNVVIPRIIIQLNVVFTTKYSSLLIYNIFFEGKHALEPQKRKGFATNRYTDLGYFPPGQLHVPPVISLRSFPS